MSKLVETRRDYARYTTVTRYRAIRWNSATRRDSSNVSARTLDRVSHTRARLHRTRRVDSIELQLATSHCVFQSVQTDVDKIEPPSPAPSPAASSAPAFQPIILETEGSYVRRISNSASAEPLVRRKCHQQQESFPDRQPKDTACELSPRQFASCVTDDHFETFGRYVAGKLKKSMPRQSIIAEKVIAEVLSRANLGTLEETTSLTEKVPSRCFLVMGDR